jgi:hypothetical protein
MTRLHQQVAQTIQYYRAQQGGSAPVRLFLAGGGASMLYTAEFFQEKLNLPVEFLNPFRNVELGPEVDPESLAREAHSLGEMAGLGLRATTVGMTEFNLLPKREKISRQVDKRGPYAIATIFCAGLILYVSGAAHRSISAKNEGGIKKMEQGLGDFEKTATKISDVEGQLFDRKGKAEKMERILRSRFYWIELLNSIQGTLDDSDGKILILTNPDKLMPKSTNVVNQINAEKVAEANTAVWLKSLTMAQPAGSSGGKPGGGFGSGGEMGGGGGIPSGGGGMGEGGMGGMGGMGEGGMGEGGMGEGGGGSSKDESVEVIFLKLMAKNVLADAANGQKVRTRETLNREFAQMMAEQFQNNEMFSDDATLTKVDGRIAMKEIDGTRWFEFVIQLTLKYPIVMKDKAAE